jgi:hypothetical protein
LIRSPATVEHRQSWHSVDRKPGDHLGLSVALDLPLLDDDVPDERLEHLGGDSHMVTVG